MCDLINCEDFRKHLSISKNNETDLIGHNGRLFIAVELIGKAFIETPYVDVVDKIASFFEKEENWNALKNCWLVDGYSEDLRKLLEKAIKE